MRIMISVLTLLLVASTAAAQSPAAKPYRALLSEFEEEGGARLFAKRFLALADQYPHEPEATDALIWVVDHVRGRTDTTQALDRLAKSHIKSEKLAAACKAIASSRSVAAESVLRAAIDKSPHAAVQSQACFFLAALLEFEANLVDQLKAQPELAPRVLQYYGKEYGAHLKALTSESLAEQRESVYERMLDSYAKVDAPDGTKMGQIARDRLYLIRHLSVGKVAPEIEGEDIHGKRFKLSDYRGKVVMVTFWGHW